MWIEVHNNGARLSRYTYRCAVLPDHQPHVQRPRTECLNAPTGAWCSLTMGLTHYGWGSYCLNAPTGAWCSLTLTLSRERRTVMVSMHLQVRGAP